MSELLLQLKKKNQVMKSFSVKLGKENKNNKEKQQQKKTN